MNTFDRIPQSYDKAIISIAARIHNLYLNNFEVSYISNNSSICPVKLWSHGQIDEQRPTVTMIYGLGNHSIDLHTIYSRKLNTLYIGEIYDEELKSSIYINHVLLCLSEITPYCYTDILTVWTAMDADNRTDIWPTYQDAIKALCELCDTSIGLGIGYWISFMKLITGKTKHDANELIAKIEKAGNALDRIANDSPIQIELLSHDEASEYSYLLATFKHYIPELTDDQLAICISITTGVCPHCYEADKSCQCWNDD